MKKKIFERFYKIDNYEINSIEDSKKIINNKNINDTITIKVKYKYQN